MIASVYTHGIVFGAYKFATLRMSDICQGISYRLLWGRPVEAIPQELLHSAAAVAALGHFLVVCVMVSAQIWAFIECR